MKPIGSSLWAFCYTNIYFFEIFIKISEKTGMGYDIIFISYDSVTVSYQLNKIRGEVSEF